jgi:NAD(P)H-hydrate epimerase
VTGTFGAPRRGHLIAREWCGKVIVIDIGFPPADPSWPLLATDAWARATLPAFHSTMHKGDRGKVLIVGGDDGMAGAAIHAARSALYAGAGMVKLAAAEPTIRAAQETLPDALTVVSRLGPGLEPDLEKAIDWADSLVVGPGLGRGKDRSAFLKALLDRAAKPAVIDADALHAGVENWSARKAVRVVTPHAGEFKAAFGSEPSDRFRAAADAAKSSHTTVLLKGVPTIIATPDGAVQVSASGNPALATGGSGDVLSGIIGALLAMKMDPGPAATLGAHAMGRAAEIAAQTQSARATRPSDVMAALPELWKTWGDSSVVIDPPVLVELPAIQLA